MTPRAERRPDAPGPRHRGRVARRGDGGYGDGGSVTAETALALPALMVVLAAVLSAGQVLAAQLRCVDAARATARLAARGEPEPRSVAEGHRLGPPGSRVEVEVAGTAVTVRVSARLTLPLGVEVPVEADVAAEREQP